MAASLVLLVWGAWSILRAPVLAARFCRAERQILPPDCPDLDWKGMAPWGWRVLGVAWLVLGGLGVFYEL